MPLPPPPPPPPLPPLLSNKKHEISPYTNYVPLSATEEVTKALKKSLLNTDQGDKIMLSFYKQVKPVIQEGPQCGLVALSMASQILLCESCCVQEIFHTAQNLKFTRLGEIFSAANMGILCETLLNCKSKVVTDLFINKNTILNHILNGWPVLISYDADKNHEPCFRKGHSAHWAVITGILLIMSPNSCSEEVFSSFGLHHISNGHSIEKYLNDAQAIFLYAHHGKSKNLAVWEMNNLFSSNMNLTEASVKHRETEMVIPTEDELCELRNKAVLLNPGCDSPYRSHLLC